MESKYNKYITEEEQRIVLKMFMEGYNTVQIGKRIGKNNSSIGRFLKKNGLTPQNKKTGLLKADEEKIIELYRGGKTAREILPLFANKVKSENTIMSIVKQAGINRGNGVQTDADVNYFETIDTEEKAYFLGLFLSDGNVHKVKRNTEQYAIQICLQSKDSYILSRFKDEIHSLNKLRFAKNRNECYFGIHSVKMAHDLMRYGVVPCKSLIAELNYDVPKDLFRHYIRGLFDGNGTVYKYKYKNGTERLRFGLYGTYKIVTQFQDWLVEQIGITKHKIFNKGTVSFTVYQKEKDVRQFYDLIYKDTTIYLKRKKELFDNYFNAST